MSCPRARPSVRAAVLAILVVAVSTGSNARSADPIATSKAPTIAGRASGGDLVAARTDADRFQRAVEWEKKQQALDVARSRGAGTMSTAGAAADDTIGSHPADRRHRFAGRAPPTFG